MTVDSTVPPVHLHIGGETIGTGSAGSSDHIFPASGEVQGSVPLAGTDQVDAAVDAADRAFASWRRWVPADRARVLRNLAALMERDIVELARLFVLDVGMPVAASRTVVTTASRWANYYAGWADKIEGRVTSVPAHQRELAFTVSEPFGVIGIIFTWNGPIASIGMKLLPALAAGNTVVVKPSELAPFVVEHFMKLVREAGIPDGVVNVVFGGPEAGEALVRHPRVQKISFTGGPATARKVLAACADGIKPAVLELGGKSANIVYPDADLEAAANANAVRVLGGLAGQACSIPSRMLIHEDVYDQVSDRIVTIAEGMRVGDPFDSQTSVGPLITRSAQARVLDMIERAKTGGDGTLLFGGRAPGGNLADGFFVEPTVFGEVDPTSELGQVEIFGPVLSLLRFSTEEEAIALANATDYGLASYLYTRDIARIHRFVEQLHAGGVYVNGAGPVTGCELPFGGVGLSGFGREGGEEGLREFLRTKAVGIA